MRQVATVGAPHQSYGILGTAESGVLWFAGRVRPVPLEGLRRTLEVLEEVLCVTLLVSPRHFCVHSHSCVHSSIHGKAALSCPCLFPSCSCSFPSCPCPFPSCPCPFLSCLSLSPFLFPCLPELDKGSVCPAFASA